MGNEFLINMGINFVLTALGTFIKNPKSKDAYKKAMLKVYNSIKTTFAGDPDFQ